MKKAISIKDVTKDYVCDEQTIITPVHDVNLEIECGEFVMIIGRSGSGKTTLLNIAAGLVKPSSGKAFIGETDIWSITDSQLCALRNKKIGFIFQFPSLLPSLNALENVVMPAYLAPRNGREAPYVTGKRLLEMMGLADRMQAFPRHLSSGEQRRVVIARSLMNSPEILLADEPTSDLDVQTEKEIMGLLKEANNNGTTILMVTHGLDLITFANRSYKMDNGVLSAL
jgi:ABC-type lipoprotein export system ATPase subunit